MSETGNINDNKRNQKNPMSEESFIEIIKEEDTPHVSGHKGIILLAMRSDDDSPTALPGNYTILKLDEQGRLKVSSKPASYPDITGDITAIQPIIGTPVQGGSVSGDVSRSSNLMIFCTGTFSGINCTFEGSLEATGETNWFSVQAIRTNANTIETTTGALSAQPAYAWEASVNALKRFRVRATARTSGTQSWRFVQGTYATEPIPGSQVTAVQPISGAVNSTIMTPSTANGIPSHNTYVSFATVNNTLVKNSAGVISDIEVTNNSTSWAYLKLYNKASAPVAGTDTPQKQIGIPPGDSFPVTFSAPFNRFPLGIGFAITRGIALNDNTAVGLNEVSISISYA